jgi:hypothetical protein
MLEETEGSPGERAPESSPGSCCLGEGLRQAFSQWMQARLELPPAEASRFEAAVEQATSACGLTVRAINSVAEARALLQRHPQLPGALGEGADMEVLEAGW